MKLFFRKTGDGFPLIILHGLFGMSDNWMSLAKVYAQEGFTVYLPDLRNHGQSPHDDEFNFETMSEDLLELFRREKIESAHLAGHSLGGKAAMFLACRHPELVSKLVVSDIAPRYYEPHHLQVLNAIHSVDFETVQSRSEAEKQMEKFLPDVGTRQFLLKNLYWKESAEKKKLDWRFHLAAIERNIEASGQALPEIFSFEGPALFIRGERSGYITSKDYNLILHHFPNAKIETVPNAGHWIHADNPEGFSKVMMRFLSEGP